LFNGQKKKIVINKFDYIFLLNYLFKYLVERLIPLLLLWYLYCGWFPSSSVQSACF